ncbi:HlyD family secretion protein [Desulfurella sp.]|uniref:HlyD family secretion protein n=1 Tax=Desulfurella sp. TaxID=1962857 RepID=UPI003D0F2471
MRTKIIFLIASIGILIGLVSAYIYNKRTTALPPVHVEKNPYEAGLYATGIIESYQTNGENINIFPDVSGRVVKIFAKDGQNVKKGAPLFKIDDTQQKNITQQAYYQMQAALAYLQKLKAEPRKETLEVSKAQLEYAKAQTKAAKDQWDKVEKAFKLNPNSVSKSSYDSARDSYDTAQANYQLALKQYELTKAGAWSYDIKNAQSQYESAQKAYLANKALLDKYTVRAPVDGVVLKIATAVGSYVSPSGSYGTYTQGYGPVVVMGNIEKEMEVRCYVDEILVPRLPKPQDMQAIAYIRGTDKKIPLEFVNLQPYTTPKIELSNQRTEQVDVRVLPIVFKFRVPKDITIYPGMLVDVYIGEKK